MENFLKICYNKIGCFAWFLAFQVKYFNSFLSFFRFSWAITSLKHYRSDLFHLQTSISQLRLLFSSPLFNTNSRNPTKKIDLSQNVPLYVHVKELNCSNTKSKNTCCSLGSPVPVQAKLKSNQHMHPCPPLTGSPSTTVPFLS